MKVSCLQILAVFLAVVITYVLSTKSAFHQVWENRTWSQCNSIFCSVAFSLREITESCALILSVVECSLLEDGRHC